MSATRPAGKSGLGEATRLIAQDAAVPDRCDRARHLARKDNCDARNRPNDNVERKIARLFVSGAVRPGPRPRVCPRRERTVDDRVEKAFPMLGISC